MADLNNPLLGLARRTRIGNSASMPSRSPLVALGGGAAADKFNEPPQRAVQIFPPWQYPIASARAFYARSYNNVVAAGATDFLIPGLNFVTANGQDACIRSMVVLVLAPLTTMNLFFTLKLNNVTVPGWDQLQVPPVNASAIEQPFTGPDDVIRVAQGTTITVTCTNGAGAFTVGVAFGGWFWPSVDAARLMGGSDY